MGEQQDRVLVVDDEPSVRLTIKAFLEGQGMVVETAENGGVTDPSSQLTFTVHGPSPGTSVNEPRLNVLAIPSAAVWSSAGVATGATLFTVTVFW